jgi:hypothetical protein
MRPGERVSVRNYLAAPCLLLFIGATCGDARAVPPVAAIVEALPPGLRAFATPWPDLLPDRSGRLAFVATIAHRANRANRFTADPLWQRIGGWPATPAFLFTSKREAPEPSPALFPVPDARYDPDIDFAASVAAANLDPHDFTCNFPDRARFLARHGLMPTPLATDEGRCRAVRNWVDPGAAVAVDIIFASPGWDDASASFGHVLFRVRTRHGLTDGGDSFEPTFAWVAQEDPETTSNFVWRGLTGGLTAGVDLAPMGTVIANYVRRDGRDLHVFELMLSPAERNDLLHIVHAQHRIGMLHPYAFFSDNCASLAWDALMRVMPELPELARPMLHPHAIVSELLRAGRARPLGTLRTARTRAREAVRTRADAMARLRRTDAFPDAGEPDADTTPAAVREAVMRLDAARDAPLETRERAARSLAYALTPLPPLPAATATDLAIWLESWLDLEDFALDEARGGFDPAADAPIIRELLAARAQLPTTPEPPLRAVAHSPITPSGSHLATVAIASTGHGETMIDAAFALIEEQLGEARQVPLRRGRTVILRNAATFVAGPGSPPTLARFHATVFDVLAPGDGLSAGPSNPSHHLGLSAVVEFLSEPESDIDGLFRVRAGPSLTLLNNNDFEDHIIATLSLEAAVLGQHGLAGVFGMPMGIEIGTTDPTSGTAIRLRSNLKPALDTDGVFRLGWSLELSADLVLSGPCGILLRTSFSWRGGDSETNGWRLGLGMLF